jgi:hypothetical protein
LTYKDYSINTGHKVEKTKKLEVTSSGESFTTQQARNKESTNRSNGSKISPSRVKLIIPEILI